MTDDRPRPQYGEYATPEQQAAAMGQPYVQPQPQAQPVPAPAVEQVPDGAPAVSRQSGYANRFFTILLLAFGGLNLFSAIPGYLGFANALQNVMKASGESSAPVPASVNAAGIPILIANVVLYALTLFLSAFAMRRGRVSVYIPVVGFVVFALVAGILLAVYAPGYLAELQD